MVNALLFSDTQHSISEMIGQKLFDKIQIYWFYQDTISSIHQESIYDVAECWIHEMLIVNE